MKHFTLWAAWPRLIGIPELAINSRYHAPIEMITHQTLGLADGTPRLEQQSLRITRFAKKNTAPSLVLSSPREDLHPEEVADAISGIPPARYHEPEPTHLELNK